MLSYGNPAHLHDPVGWPTFKDWPSYPSLTHEQSYYRWLERSWRAGQRVFVNLLVDNAVLCELYPLKKNSCNEMDGVRLQARRIHELQDYIDAQHGGPGKGWFRIVKSPYEARRVINQGKLAVILGIEVSKLFDCGINNEQAECTAPQIDQRLDEVYDMGVRDMELVNKFDNALAGVAGDSGTTGVVVNNGNKIETGKYWQMTSCDGHNHVEDRTQYSLPGVERDSLAGNVLRVFGTSGAAPVYPPAPHCNVRGLSPLGAHLVKRMIAKKMIVDPDHLSVRARNQLLDIVEAAKYSGIISSHSWSTPDAIPRIYRLGGFVTPYAGASKDFVTQWREALPVRDKRFYQGVGWGADMNGFGAQGGPRGGANPVTYPFKSWDGKVTIGQQHSGQRVYDINKDGVAHYGLYPDWVEDLRHLAGQQIIDDLGRGSEAYLQMWERADGIPTGCRPAKAKLTRRGLAGARLGASNAALLRRAGQPKQRGAKAWRYCVDKGKLVAAPEPGGAGGAGRLDRARPQGARDPHGDEGEARPQGHARLRARRAQARALRLRGPRRAGARGGGDHGEDAQVRPALAPGRRVALTNGGWVGMGFEPAREPTSVVSTTHTAVETTLVPPRHLEPTPTQPPFAGALEERLALAAVGRHRLHDLVAAHEVQLVEALAQLARLRVAHPDDVADPQLRGGAAVQRRLDLAGALVAVELQPFGRKRRGQPVRARRARRRVAAAEQRRGVVVGPPDDREREQRRGLGREAAVGCRTASARTGPSPAATSVTAASAAVRSIEPVPPPLTKRSCATARTAATTSARRPASSRADIRCIVRIAAPISGLSRRAIADARDVALVAHEPVELELLARDDRLREQRGVVGRAHRRAPGADLHPAAQRPPAGVDVEADADRPAAGLADGRDRELEVLDAVDHDRHALARPGRQLAQGGAVDGRVGDDQVVVAVPRQPQRLGQREGEDSLQSGGQRALDQRPAAHGLRGEADRRPARRGAADRRRCDRTHRGREPRTAAPERPSHVSAPAAGALR